MILETWPGLILGNDMGCSIRNGFVRILHDLESLKNINFVNLKLPVFVDY